MQRLAALLLMMTILFSTASAFFGLRLARAGSAHSQAHCHAYDHDADLSNDQPPLLPPPPPHHQAVMLMTLHALLPQIASHLDPRSTVKLAACSKMTWSLLMSQPQFISYKRQQSCDQLTDSDWLDYQQFLPKSHPARTPRTSVYAVPYLSNALKLRFVDGSALQHFLALPDAADFTQIAVDFLSPQEWRAENWQNLHLLKNAEKIELNLNHFHLGDLGAAWLAQVLAHPNNRLSALGLRFNSITAVGGRQLAQALREPHNRLSALDLSWNHLSDDGAKELALTLRHPNNQLKSLDLSWNDLSATGLKAVALALRNHNNRLTALNLHRNRMPELVAQTLARTLTHPHNHLHHLNVSCNQLQSAGAIALAAALRSNLHLRHLNLSRNHIKTTGAIALAAALKENRHLRHLNLSDNQIQGAGAKAIALALQANPQHQLILLNLTENLLIPACLQAELKAAVLHCHFIF